ncbi:surface carbohydrate biosynthesis protein [Solemya velum gill symbiont]|uniref:Uncharacterized protein n=1 Tax=Solemya velum gill symbiont TaxID=2340 RepID=A0A0B0H5C7_SOVGS|nr:surface carbohydrate biosynthesis protein [Solemya velum gill symbiont]KHF25378.1 hypothetical protein JV46_06940 [Solemya velum gill symbiont]OOZ15765.1 hypothetical protein BOW27_02270 [Solemya velum gill symbiont]OOZ20871.1 hypothetical protein BOW29_00540 [Solemya velum gill symbiont]OOZ23710.1 hypothetical protein BOW30_01480 [Solemya velum gill symbiont]OOZ25254.1 hypothetical protein BOW31_02915 [Solemya velum gill symbiont]
MEKPVYYFDVEIKKRELLSRLLLAAMLAERGCHTFVGPRARRKEQFDRLSLTSGAVVKKSIPAHAIDQIRGLHDSGFGCIAMDEEGLLVDNLERFATVKQSPQTVSLTEKIFLWGDKQREFLKQRYPLDEEKFLTPGNVRVLLWKNRYYGYFDESVKSISNKYEDFILVVSNFGFYTNREMYETRYYENGHFDNEENRIEYEDRIKKLEFIYNAFVSIVKRLACDGRMVVFRAHPGDNVEYIEREFEGLDNIFICATGEVTPWILASSALIHNCCTTAIEAAFMNKKVVSYCPDGVTRYSLDSVNNVGHIADNANDAIKFLGDEYGMADGDMTIDGFLRQDISLDEYCTEFMSVKYISDFDVKSNTVSDGLYNLAGGIRYSFRVFRESLILNKQERIVKKTMRDKFPFTRPNEVNKFLGCLMDNGVVRKKITALPVKYNLFYIHSD